MKKILIFGGTSEGRELAEWCSENGIAADVSVTTDYGSRLLGSSEMLNVFTGKLDCPEMRTLISVGDYAAVVDATHPYATEATKNIRNACSIVGIDYYRLTREECELSGTCVESFDELVGFLNTNDKIVLSTLGSKEFSVFKKVNNCYSRMWFRVLPALGIDEICRNNGFDPTHIIADNPPYSIDVNIQHIQKSGAGILVTKECGIKGGYPEKIAAANACGIETITVKRPPDSGISFDKLTERLTEKL